MCDPNRLTGADKVSRDAPRPTRARTHTAADRSSIATMMLTDHSPSTDHCLRTPGRRAHGALMAARAVRGLRASQLGSTARAAAGRADHPHACMGWANR